MGAGRWARSAVARLPEVVCSLYSLWRASFRNRSGLRRKVPNHPMREQSARRVRIIDDQDKAFRLEGTSEICKGGLVFAPSHENFDGMFAPSWNAELVTFI